MSERHLKEQPTLNKKTKCWHASTNTLQKSNTQALRFTRAEICAKMCERGANNQTSMNGSELGAYSSASWVNADISNGIVPVNEFWSRYLKIPWHSAKKTTA